MIVSVRPAQVPQSEQMKPGFLFLQKSFKILETVAIVHVGVSVVM